MNIAEAHAPTAEGLPLFERNFDHFMSFLNADSDPASIRSFNLVRPAVCQGVFTHFSRKCVRNRFGAPVPKGRAEAMHRYLFSAHAPQDCHEAHVRKRRTLTTAGENWSVRCTLLSKTKVDVDRGTRCSRPAFIRSAGMVHAASSRLTSDQVAPRTSPDRVAVRIANSTARAASPTCSRNSAMNAPQYLPRQGRGGVQLLRPCSDWPRGFRGVPATALGSRLGGVYSRSPSRGCFRCVHAV
jgi:hypothetical protein